MSLPTHLPLPVGGGKTVQVPSVGFGTWGAGEYGWCKDATVAALKAGCRHLDCAWKYGVDQEVGEAIRESGVPRSEIFITTKFWMHFATHPDDVEICLDHCLRNMGLEYVDLFLAHFPVAFKPTSREALKKAFAGPTATMAEQGIAVDPATGHEIVDLEHSAWDIAARAGVKGSYLPTWRAMQALVSTGKTRAVGVSNFSIPQLEELLPSTKGEGAVPISCNQVEAHPWLPNDEVRKWCAEHGVLMTVYSPFAGQKADGQTLLKDEKALALAKRTGMGIGQMLQSWAVQRGTIPLGKSQNPDRIKANLTVKKLSDENMAALDAMALPNDEGRTINDGPIWGVKLFQNTPP